MLTSLVRPSGSYRAAFQPYHQTEGLFCSFTSSTAMPGKWGSLTRVQALGDGGGVDEVAGAEEADHVLVQLLHLHFHLLLRAEPERRSPAAEGPHLAPARGKPKAGGPRW